MGNRCYNANCVGCAELSAAMGTAENPMPQVVTAALWGIYDESHPNNPLTFDHNNPAEVLQAAKTLSMFNRKCAIERANKVKTTPVEVAKDYKKLRKVMSLEERLRRVVMIADMFSLGVDSFRRKYPTRSREEICKGFRGEKSWIAGETAIFESIYKTLFNNYLAYKSNGMRSRADAVSKILDNWPALVSLARVRLRDTEGIKLGHKSKLASEALAYDFGDNNIEDFFNEEESTKEGWQEVKEAISAFGSLGAKVRAALGSIPMLDSEGKIIQDDLGHNQKMDPMTSHQNLQHILRGMVSSIDMMNIIEKEAKTEPWLSFLHEMLTENHQLQTQFYVKFKKDWQVYSILREYSSKGVKTFKTIIANKKEESLFKSIMLAYKSGAGADANTIFDKKGKVNWDNVKAFVEDVDTYFGGKGTIKGMAFFDRIKDSNGNYKYAYSHKERVDIMHSLLSRLGVTTTKDQLTSIVKNRKELNKLINSLIAISDNGIKTILKKDGMESLREGTLKEANFLNALVKKKPTIAQNDKLAPIEKNIKKIAEIIYEHTHGRYIESSARYKKKGKGITMYSDVTPSYLGTFIGTIHRYVDAGDHGGIQQMLESKFLDCPMFLHEGKILNRWIRDLYDEDDSFADQIEYKRFLGKNDHPFEDFTEKQHMINLWTEYWGPSQQSGSNSEYAYYPTFILGDSGVAKFIKAKRYSFTDLRNGFYDVYCQEKIRMDLASKVEEKMKANDTSTLKEFSNNKNKFTNLVFLNSDFKSADGQVGKYARILTQNPSKDQFLKALDAYMEDCITAFKGELRRHGMLNFKTTEVYNKETGIREKVTTYEYFSQVASTEEEFEEKLAEYYWNSKFAMIQQLQLMTIDPGFYMNTEDLQKRYKEIHAPGEVLDIYARDFDGNAYAQSTESNAVENAIYFNEIETNTKDGNSAFDETLSERFGEEGREAYEAYHKNALTDGQGYRTLRGYRKVMGMLGEWTEEMEYAYNKIQELRAEKKNLSEEDRIKALEEISKLAVVFQPIKPYLYTIENYSIGNGQYLKIPVQHKYAEVVLIPELLREGSTLRDMAEYMDNHVDSFGIADPIDMICSTACVKVGAFGAVSIDNLSQYDEELTNNGLTSISNKDRLNLALSKATVHKLSYSDYRKQTNVPKHMDSSQLFGTQIRKLIMSGLSLNKNYDYNIGDENGLVNLGGSHGKVRLSGRNILNFYNALIVSNILESLDEFEKVVGSLPGASSALLQSVIDSSRGSEDNFLAYALGLDGDFEMPICEGSLEHDSAALLLSLFKKKVNKQRIKGGSFVQASSFGIDEVEEDGGLQFVVDKKNKNVLYAQCEIPFDFSYTDAAGNKVELDFYDYCEEDGTPKMGTNGKTLIEERFPGILDFVAYRIPTERHYSMINLKVKRFTHKQSGGVIKVPPEGTTIAGFDFDIDKLYFMRKEYKSGALSQKQIMDVWEKIYADNPDIKNVLQRARAVNPNAHADLHRYWEEAKNINQMAKQLLEDKQDIFHKYAEALYGDNFISYDYSKSPLENDVVARNNMLIEIMRNRLQDPETFNSRYTPGGFKNNSTSARIMRELEYGNIDGIVDSNGKIDWEALEERAKNKDTDPKPNYDPSDPLTLIKYNQQNQIAGKLIGVFANQNTNHAFSTLLEKFSLKNPIKFAGKSYSDLLSNPDGVDTSLAVAELLAASVDAVKDPVLNFMNYNTMTANGGALLARLGFNATEIGLLFNQPIIKEICELAFNEGILDHEIAINRVVSEYKGKNSYNISKNSEILTTDVLANSILAARKAKNEGKSLLENRLFVENQIQAAMLFTDIMAAAKDVTSFVQATKFTAANAVGSTFGEMYAQQYRVKEYINSTKDSKVNVTVAVDHANPVDNVYLERALKEGKIDKAAYIESLRDNPLAFEQAMYDANRRALQVLSKYYPYDTKIYTGARDYLNKLSKLGYLDAETINDIHSDFMVFLLSTMHDSNFNGNTVVFSKTENKNISMRDYYTKVFPMELLKFKGLFADSGLSLLDRLVVEEDENNDLKIRMLGAVGSSPLTKDAIRNEWTELMKHPNGKALSQGLFFYNFFSSGYAFGPGTFMHLAPTEVKSSLVIGTRNGVDYTYREFLQDLVKGNIYSNGNSAANKEFAKQFILNHLDNYRLAFTPSKGSEIEKLLIEESQIKNGAAIIQASEFTIDLSDSKWEDKGFYVTNKQDHKNSEYVFKPCLVIDGIPYICDSGIDSFSEEAFNVTNTPVMTYYRMDRLGKKNVSVKYGYGEQNTAENSDAAERSLLSSLQSDALEDAAAEGTTAEGIFGRVYEEFNREQVIQELVEEYTKQGLQNGNISIEQVSGFQNAVAQKFKTMDESVLKGLVDNIRAQSRVSGTQALDEEGNPSKLC